MDSGFQVLDSGSFASRNLDSEFQSLVDSGFLEQYSVFQNPGFQISQAKFSRIPKSGFLYMGWMKTWASVDLVYVDCEQSLFFFFRFSEGNARARERRETGEMRAAARREKWTSFVSRLQSRAWSFACLARFDRWNKKRGRLLVVYCFRDAGIIWQPSKGYPTGGKKRIKFLFTF